MFFLTELVQFFCCDENISKSLSTVDQFENLSLFFIEGDVDEVTNLGLQIDFISKIEFVDIFVNNLEEVLFVQFPITIVETFGQTRIPTFHHLLDANIFNDVHELWRNLDPLEPVIIRSVEGVSNLMTHKEIIDNVRGLLPHRESQNPSLNVETRRLNFLVFHHQVLGGEEFSKLGLDLVADSHSHSFVWTHNTTNPASWTGSCDAF